MTTALADGVAHRLDEVGLTPEFRSYRLPLLTHAVRAVAKAGGLFLLMWKMVYYTILVLGVASALSIVLGLLLIVLPGPMLLFGIVAIVCPFYQK